jgi:hypothetical protein
MAAVFERRPLAGRPAPARTGSGIRDHSAQMERPFNDGRTGSAELLEVIFEGAFRAAIHVI